VRYPLALADLETAVLAACAAEQEWPAQVTAGVFAGVDHAIAHPEVAAALDLDTRRPMTSDYAYDTLVTRFTGFLRFGAPTDRRLPGSTDEALVCGIVSVVGDHLRIGRCERLRELRPDLALLTLLPYLGFEEAQRWVNCLGEAPP
jgi:hypothetical protein